MRGARGQITVFFLVGLAVLIVLLIILAIRSMLQKDASENVPVQDFDAALIKGYVEQCIDASAEEGFSFLSQQGGVIYASQGGTTAASDSLSATVGATPLGYGLASSTANPFRPPQTPTEYQALSSYDAAKENPYPLPGQPVLLSNQAYLAAWADLTSDGPFGQYALPPLCRTSGPNTVPGAVQECPPSLTQNPLSVHGESIQTSLAGFIEKRLAVCIEPDAVGQLLGTHVTIDQPEVEVTYTRHETLIDVNLTIRSSSDTGAVRVSRFARTYPVRLFDTLWFAENLLKKESKELLFDPSVETQVQTVPGYDRFAVTVNPVTLATGAHAHAIMITDPASTVRRSHWFFQFLVADRQPVLARIGTPSGTHAVGPLTISAADPDSDTLTATLEKKDTSGNFQPLATQTITPPATAAAFSSTPLVATSVYKVSVASTSNPSLKDWEVFNTP